MKKDPQDPFAPLWKRGVSKQVAAERGYLPYYGKKHPLYDPEGVKVVYAPFGLTSGQAGTNTGFMNQARDVGESLEKSRCPVVDGKRRCKGPKCECVGWGDGLVMPKFSFPGEAPILPQLRPRDAVYTGTKTWHRHDAAFLDPRDLERHIADEHPGEAVAGDVLHSHLDDGKYLLQSKAKQDFWHDHSTDSAYQGVKGSAKLRAHVRAHHKGEKVTGEHKHRRDVPGQSVANRIDVGPWGVGAFATAERVYFVLEGTPKNDAIKSRLDATGELAAVCNVPSVTLTKCPELERVARRYFAHVPLVVLVVDADWHENPRVVRHALLLRERLHGLGVNVCIAAPPTHRDEDGKLLYKGVDDFLHAGGELNELVVVDRQAKFSLALHAVSTEESPAHTLQGTVWGYSEVLRCRRDPERIAEVLQNHIDRGLITTDRSLELVRDDWSGALGWKEAPTFTIPEAHQYRQEFIPLGEFEPPANPLVAVANAIRGLQKFNLDALPSSSDGEHKGLTTSDVQPTDGSVTSVHR